MQTFTIPKNNLYFFQRLLVFLCICTFEQVAAAQTDFSDLSNKHLSNTITKQKTINGLSNIVPSVQAINNGLANKVVLGKSVVDSTNHLTKKQKLDAPTNNSLFDAFLQIKLPAGWVIMLFWIGMWLMAPSMLMPKKK